MPSSELNTLYHSKSDLQCGIELKSLANTSNLERRIDKSLKNTQKKKDLSAVILTHLVRALMKKRYQRLWKTK